MHILSFVPPATRNISAPRPTRERRRLKGRAETEEGKDRRSLAMRFSVRLHVRNATQAQERSREGRQTKRGRRREGERELLTGGLRRSRARVCGRESGDARVRQGRRRNEEREKRFLSKITQNSNKTHSNTIEPAYAKFSSAIHFEKKKNSSQCIRYLYI